jgi:hypothetical protein
MKFVTLSIDKAKRLFMAVALGATGLAIVTASQADPILLASSILVMLLGLFPLYLWVIGSSHGLPIWPAFAGYTGLSSSLPVIQSSASLLTYSSTAVFTGLLTMGFFLILGTVVWLASTSRAPIPPKTVLMLGSKSTVQSLLVCLGVGLLFNANNVAGWFQFPGNSMQVARGIAGGLGFFGCFGLAYLHGSGHLHRSAIFAYITIACLMVAFSLTSLMLANAVAPITLVLIGFTLGAGRVPWKSLLVLFVVLAVLHPGKYPMRQIYEENPEKRWSLGIMQMPAFYSEWVSYGLESLGGVSGVFKATANEEAAPSTVFDRAGTLHMLLLVQDKSPDQVPFLDGMTYAPIPYLLVPRFLAPDKGLSHAGNMLLSVNYGLQDIEGTRSTSIGWNLVAEAYANFGYAGVVGIAVFMGLLYGTVSRLTAGVPLTSFRFVSGLIVLAGVTNDNSLGVFLTMQFQGVIGVALASIFLMRRQPNPFAEEQGAGSVEQGVGRWGRKGRGVGVSVIRQDGVAVGDNGMQQEADGGGKQLAADPPTHTVTPAGQVAADGGVVRTMPIRTPKRIASWMPRRVRAAVVAQYAAQSVTEGVSVGQKDGVAVEGSASAQGGSGVTRERPRQVAVPYQNYRRYRG